MKSVVLFVVFLGTSAIFLVSTHARMPVSTCAPNTTEETDMHNLRDKLARHELDSHALAKAQQELGHASLCPNANRPWIAELMRLLADNWQRTGQLTLADSTLETAFKLVRADHSKFLQQIAILRDWSELRLEQHNSSSAINMAHHQAVLARAAYAEGTFSAGLYASSLDFEASVFDRIGDEAKANELRAQARSVRTVEPVCSANCLVYGQPHSR